MQFATAHGLESDPPRGVSGLRALSTLIARARDVDADEQPFVEGAGAYLGLLLLDHWPAATHAANAGEHRLRLGTYGFFDPFAAISTALDAGDARRALLDAIRVAEAEAAGTGPTARVVSAVLSKLVTLPNRDALRVLGHFDRTLWLEIDGQRAEIDLTRIIDVTCGEPNSVLDHAVARLCASLSYEPAPVLGWEAARDQLFPRLVGRNFVASLPHPDDLVLLPLGSEVWMTLVLRYRERARYVRQLEVDTWSKDGAAPQAQALHNLAQSCKRARFLQHETTHGPLVIAESRDGFDASRLLLPGLHDVLAPVLGSPFVAAVPHRDTLLACALGSHALIDELSSRAHAAWQRAPHAIADALWLVTGRGQFEAFSNPKAAPTSAIHT